VIEPESDDGRGGGSTSTGGGGNAKEPVPAPAPASPSTPAPAPPPSGGTVKEPCVAITPTASTGQSAVFATITVAINEKLCGSGGGGVPLLTTMRTIAPDGTVVATDNDPVETHSARTPGSITITSYTVSSNILVPSGYAQPLNGISIMWPNSDPQVATMNLVESSTGTVLATASQLVTP
jgi:hypothetical protein